MVGLDRLTKELDEACDFVEGEFLGRSCKIKNTTISLVKGEKIKVSPRGIREKESVIAIIEMFRRTPEGDIYPRAKIEISDVEFIGWGSEIVEDKRWVKGDEREIVIEGRGATARIDERGRVRIWV